MMAFGLGELTDFLNKGERFSEIPESKRALDAASIIKQLPIGSLCLQALGFILRQWRNATATRRARLLGECLDHNPCPRTIMKAGLGSWMHLLESDIERTMVAETNCPSCRMQ